jgi:hypothetical protein
MKHFTNQDFEQWNRFYRANVINSISGLKQANLIATINKEGITNVAMFSSVTIQYNNTIHNLVIRESFSETPPRVEYSLTQKGLDLLPVLSKVVEWYDAYETDEKYKVIKK